MFIRQLSYLVALSREKHFGRAAEACHVSQPALSNAIRGIEAELGIAIVNRNHRFEGFTEDGERVLAWARRVLKDCEGLRQEARSPHDSPSGVLRLGIIPASVPIAPRLTQACLHRHPRIRHEIRTIAASEILQRLQRFDIDVGLTYLDDERLGDFDTQPVFTERYVLAAASTAAFDGARCVSWSEVADLPLCLFGTDMQCRRGIDAAFARAGREVVPRLESDSMTSLCAHVHGAGLYSVLPHSVLCLPILAMPLATIPIVPELHRAIGLVMPARQPRGRVLQAALDCFAGVDLQYHVDTLLGEEAGSTACPLLDLGRD